MKVKFFFLFLLLLHQTTIASTNLACYQNIVDELTQSNQSRVNSPHIVKYDLEDTPFNSYTETFKAYKNRFNSFEVHLPIKNTFSKRALSKIRTIEKELQLISKMGTTQKERVRAIVNSVGHLVEYLDQTAYINILKKKLKVIRQLKPPISVTTKPFKNSTPLDVKKFSNMEEIENSFDVMARKASTPIKNTIHEVDTALITQGVSNKILRVGKEGQLGIQVAKTGDKVFAVGYKGAVNFQGALSNVGGERFYGLIFEKGFIQQHGVDLRTLENTRNPSASIFKDLHAPKGNVFSIRGEPATQELGQVHINFRGGYESMNIDGQVMSQRDWVNQHVKGVVEFDKDGNIKRIIPVNN